MAKSENPLKNPKNRAAATQLVHGGTVRSQHGETSEAMFLNSGFIYPTSAAAERRFKNEDPGYIYSRFSNPTVEMFQDRMKLLDGAEACYATASGMSAVFTALAALCGAGDRLVASRSLFGSCFVICNEILPRWGVETVFVDGTDLDQWEEALSVPTAAVFFETPSNPMQEIVDIRRVSELAHAAGAKVVLDNVFATPILQRGFDLGADITVYSGTKHIDGQGRVMGGAILGAEEYIDGPVKNLIRHTGPSLSPFNAWTLVKGLETMSMRVERMTANALRIAEFLESHAATSWVKYPFLTSHPQYELAKAQMSGGGTVITFELDAPADQAKARAFAFLNKLRIIDISNNLGDAKSMSTHPATTTHRAMGPEGRAAIGITDGVVRLSVGLEHIDALLEDVEQALAP